MILPMMPRWLVLTSSPRSSQLADHLNQSSLGAIVACRCNAHAHTILLRYSAKTCLRCTPEKLFQTRTQMLNREQRQGRQPQGPGGALKLIKRSMLALLLPCHSVQLFHAIICSVDFGSHQCSLPKSGEYSMMPLEIVIDWEQSLPPF